RPQAVALAVLPRGVDVVDHEVEGRFGLRLDLPARAREQKVGSAAEFQNGKVFALADGTKPTADEESRGPGDVAHFQKHVPDGNGRAGIARAFGHGGYDMAGEDKQNICRGAVIVHTSGFSNAAASEQRRASPSGQAQPAVHPAAGAAGFEGGVDELHGAGAVLDGGEVEGGRVRLLAEAAGGDGLRSFRIEHGEGLLVAFGMADTDTAGAQRIRLESGAATLEDDGRLAQARMVELVRLLLEPFEAAAGAEDAEMQAVDGASTGLGDP